MIVYVAGEWGTTKSHHKINKCIELGIVHTVALSRDERNIIYFVLTRLLIRLQFIRRMEFSWGVYLLSLISFEYLIFNTS